MKSVLSIFISCVFLLQTFVTLQAMPIHEGKAEMPCMVKDKDIAHTCCTIQSTKTEQKEKKGCCTGTSKMSCCISIIALVPNEYQIIFLSKIYKKSFFGYSDSTSSCNIDIFHPPALV